MTPVDGSVSPLGFSKTQSGGNFALFSKSAKNVVLGLFTAKAEKPLHTYSLRKTKDIWHLEIQRLPSDFYYAFEIEDQEGKKTWISDPFSKLIDFQRDRLSLALCKEPLAFDWENVNKPKLRKEDLIIYEMHVRGFTKDSSSKTTRPGTFSALIEKIPHLKSLGVNAIELMPIFAFERAVISKALTNYWGYAPLFFFFPMPIYSASENPEEVLFELKTLIKELHRNEIEIILDVVFNHTGEGHKTVHFRAADPQSYYMQNEEGFDLNYSGCGNTLNVKEKIVQKLILKSLCYWANEMQIDGFRFDLGSILTRDESTPSLFSQIQELSSKMNFKVIVEPWDAAGLYQLGFFSKNFDALEWNDYFRDTARRFMRGCDGQEKAFQDILTGSKSRFEKQKNSLNFITSHDGFTLHDLVSYEKKHNDANGEENRDGSNSNESSNNGIEGKTKDIKILKKRETQIRNFLLALFLSEGTPMLLMGDEYGHTREGNNNAYAQDNKLNWFDWKKQEENHELFDLVRNLISFRKKHLISNPSKTVFFDPLSPNESNVVTFQKGPIFASFNMSDQTTQIELPKSHKWIKITSTESTVFQDEKTGEKLKGPIEIKPQTAFLAFGIC